LVEVMFTVTVRLLTTWLMKLALEIWMGEMITPGVFVEVCKAEAESGHRSSPASAEAFQPDDRGVRRADPVADSRADRVAVRADGNAGREVDLELGRAVRSKIERLNRDDRDQAPVALLTVVSWKKTWTRLG